MLLPPGAVSNRLDPQGEAAANATILLFDQKNTPPAYQAFAIQRIVKFVQRRRTRDRIGIYTFGKDHVLRAVQELTDDPELLKRAATSLKVLTPSYRVLDLTGVSADADVMVLEFQEREADTKHVLQAIARHLAKVPGRKTLIWVTTSFPLVVETRKVYIDFRPDMEAVSHALNEANVALYAVDARGLKGALSGIGGVPTAELGGPPRVPLPPRAAASNPDPQDRRTMAMLTDLTGGLLFYDNSNGLEDSIRTAIDDGELTYTLGFYPQQEDREGVWHKLKVEVNKRGVSVRHRGNYFASRAAPSANDRPTLEELLKDSLDATQLGLVAETMPDPERPGFYRTKVNVDLHDVQLVHENARWSGGVDVSFLVEGSGSVSTKTLKIDIPDDQFAAMLEKGIDAIESMDTAGKAETVRLVVQDRATGAAGSVRIPLARR